MEVESKVTQGSEVAGDMKVLKWKGGLSIETARELCEGTRVLVIRITEWV